MNVEEGSIAPSSTVALSPDVQNQNIVSAAKCKKVEGYAIENGTVCFRGNGILGADAESFTPLPPSNIYAKDKKNAYYRGEVILGVDLASFVPVGYEIGGYSAYAKDKSNVFYQGKSINIAIDPASFVPITTVGGGVIKDKNGVYMVGSYENPYENAYTLISGADPQTFTYVGICEYVEKSNSTYFKDKNSVFAGRFTPKSEIDVQTFEYLGLVDPFGFDASFAFAKDKNRVYRSCGEILEGADPRTFSHIRDQYYQDSAHVWFQSSVIKDVDRGTFVILGEGYSKDARTVYYKASPVLGADPKTFVVDLESGGSGDSYAKDANYIFVGDKILDGVRPADCLTNESLVSCRGRVNK